MTNIDALYDEITLGDLDPYGPAAHASTEDLLAVIARLLANRAITPSNGIRILTRYPDGFIDEPVIHFRGMDAYTLQQQMWVVPAEGKTALYHPDTIHIAPDGTTMTDREVAMESLTADLSKQESTQ